MRISDWSSDVCSSDLVAAQADFGAIDVLRDDRQAIVAELRIIAEAEVAVGIDLAQLQPLGRSEEHTSELQSLMRISYAVFCLKKTQNTKKITVREHKHSNSWYTNH